MALTCRLNKAVTSHLTVQSLPNQLSQLLNGLPQRSPAFEQVGPEVAYCCDSLPHRSHSKTARANSSVLDLFPRAGRRDWRAVFGAHRVGGRKGRAVIVTSRINKNPTAAIHLVELTRQVFGIATDH